MSTTDTPSVDVQLANYPIPFTVGHYCLAPNDTLYRISTRYLDADNCPRIKLQSVEEKRPMYISARRLAESITERDWEYTRVKNGI